MISKTLVQHNSAVALNYTSTTTLCPKKRTNFETV